MSRKVLYLLIIFFLSGFLVLQSGTLNFSNYLPKVTKKADEVIFSIDTFGTKKDIYFYYRVPGIKNFQVRKMKIDRHGRVYYQLSTKNLYGKKIEYFIMEKGGNHADALSPVFTLKDFTDKDSPEVYFQEVTAPPGTGSEKQREPFIKMNASGSLASQLHDNAEFPGEKFTASGNMRLYRNIYDEKDDSEFDFDSTFTYTNQPLDTESKVNLSNMKIRFRKGKHKFEAGDVSVTHTEFSTSYLTRRGMFYEMTGKALYLSSFYTNSQQKTGFDGFGFPPSDANIFGAVAGFNMGPEYTPIFKLRGMFMAGQDNLDSKTLVSSEDAFREGSMISVLAEANLFKSYLNLKGEYAQSNFGKAADKESIEKKKDEAWSAELGFNYGVFSARADYKKLGSDFNSIANLFLQNAREGLNSSIGLNIKSFSLSVNYTDQKTNFNDPLQPILRTRTLGTNLSWLIANHLQIGAEFGTNNLDYDQSTGLQTGGTDMDTINYAGTLGYIAGYNSFTIRLGRSESRTFTSNIDGSLALNLKFGNFLTLNPTLSYQSNKNLTDDSTANIYNLYLNSELSFVPQIFTLTLAGAYSKTDNSLMEDSSTLSADANLNFYMAKIFKDKVQPVLSVKGRYQESKYGSISSSSTALYLQFDFSF